MNETQREFIARLEREAQAMRRRSKSMVNLSSHLAGPKEQHQMLQMALAESKSAEFMEALIVQVRNKWSE